MDPLEVVRVFPRDVKDMGQGFAFWMMPDEIPQGWTYIMWPQGGEVDIMEYVGSIPYNNLGWPVSADEGENETIFQIYPNPAQDLIQIQVRNPEEYTIRIADLSGKTVIHTTLDTSSSVDVSTLKEGVYLVVANNGEVTLSKRIIVQ